jgi:hypothetical protein
MKPFIPTFLLGLALTAHRVPGAAAEAPLRAAPKPQPRLGMNLNGPADWNTELPFVDVFRLSRQWISQRKGQPWGKGPALALDEHGWVTRLEPDCWAETLLCTIDGGHYPGGDYTVLYEGEGRLEAGGAGQVAARKPGTMTLRVDPSKGAIFLKLVETNPQNPVRNLRVIMPGFLDTYRDQPFHPVFLKRWQGVACLRFMDWLETNNSKQRSWADRPTTNDATFTRAGVPLELMVDLCNRLQSDAWFCLPHLADDDYVRRFARMVKARLAPALKVYVEYSNEVWNGQFAQSRWAGEQGMKLGFGQKPWEAGWRFTAWRSVQMFKIWEEVFGGTQRLLRVLPSQAANPYVSERVVEFQDAWKQADALAIAPYISCNVPKEGKRLNAALVEGWSVGQALDFMETNALPESTRWIQGNKRVADKYGLKLIAYEGGQHMVGVGGVENNETITKLLHAANAHPRMGGIYRKYYEAWTKEGGDVFCYFASTGRWSKWGSWGILQHYDDDPAQSPKFMATMRWARAMGQAVNLPE